MEPRKKTKSREDEENMMIQAIPDEDLNPAEDADPEARAVAEYLRSGIIHGPKSLIVREQARQIGKVVVSKQNNDADSYSAKQTSYLPYSPVRAYFQGGYYATRVQRRFKQDAIRRFNELKRVFISESRSR
ncbi:MAG: hypothetical protein P4M11_03330 [Candidatus Pacebacteria bacterium]|nr:hypothetical protein [Candidatus Paceibacterota bacterium]